MGLRRNALESPAQRIGLLLVVLGGWALRLVALDRQNIWWDEARNIDVALRPLVRVAVAPELDIHPPMYFWLLHLWSRLAGVTMAMAPEQIAFLTRFTSVAAGIIGVVLLTQLAQRAARPGSWAALIAAVLGSFAPFWLGESQETRMYTVGFAWLTAAAVLLMIAWETRSGRPTTSSRPARRFCPLFHGRVTHAL